MSDINKISVIMPAYNSEKYIAEAIESVIGQSYTNWELLIVDDGSEDDTGVIIDEYAGKDSRIKAVHTDNYGVSHARNTALDMASGEWVAFLDSDDFYLKDAFEALIMESEGYGLIAGNFRKLPQDRKYGFFRNSSYFTIDEIRNDFIALFSSNLFGMVWGKLFRRENIKENFNVGQQFGEDTLFTVTFIKNCHSIKTVEAEIYCYRRENVMSLSRRHINCEPRFMEKMCQAFEYLALENGQMAQECFYAYSYYLYVGYINAVATADMDKRAKLSLISEALKSKYFQGMPMKQLRLKPAEMHRFAILKTGDMDLVAREFGIED